jgi:4-hydroxy-3-polyprenylbenzoate decarboxylase
VKRREADVDSGMQPVVLAVTGASGSLYALKFMEIMGDLGQDVHLIVSRAGSQVASLEIGEEGCRSLRDMAAAVYAEDDMAAAPASGSGRWHSMVILPCTMGTMASVAHGISHNLIHRAADCFLKERRPLVIVPRETPLNRNHLYNMLRADRTGAVIYPAMPSFYHQAESLEDMAYFFAGRLAEFLGFHVRGLRRWRGLGGNGPGTAPVVRDGVIR